MTMEATLFNALKLICPRAYPDIAPTSTVRPYVTFQQIGGDTLDPLDNSSPGKRNAVMQINVWSNTRAEAVALMDQIEDSLRTVFNARPQSAKFNDYDHDMLVYGSQQEFRYWY
jgi:hypothetical protein